MISERGRGSNLEWWTDGVAVLEGRWRDGGVVVE